MDNLWSKEARASISSLQPSFSLHFTSSILFRSSFTTERLGRVSSKTCNTGLQSSSLLKHERNNRTSVSKCSISTSRTALIAPICRSIATPKFNETQNTSKNENKNRNVNVNLEFRGP